MNRAEFFKVLGLGMVSWDAALQRLGAVLPPSDPLPALFFGHGSPMNAIEENAFVAGWRELAGQVRVDREWGLDHGTWSVLRHVFPKADVPVLQLSLDRRMDAAAHFALGQTLADLRTRGVLLVGSGNLVHNLSQVAWNHLETIGYAHHWAATARELLNDHVVAGAITMTSVALGLTA